jgi:hypothetical protein
MSLLRTEPEERPSMSQAREQLAALASGEANGQPAATRVSPPLASPGAGRAPATPQPPPAAPPWRRDETPEQSRRAPTSAALPPTTASTRSRDRRKPILLGAIGAAVLVAAVVLVVAFNTGDGNTGAQQNRDSASATRHPSTTSVPKRARNTGPPVTDYGAAGQRIIAFFDDPEDSWAMLTPQAQAQFGSRDAFERYWKRKDIRGYHNARAYEEANNKDGSVDMRVMVDFGNGPRPIYFRVVNVGGTLLLDGDPRPEHNRKP